MTTADANSQAMVGVMAETGFIVRPTEAVNWRPTKRSSGTIAGILLPLKILATDGLRGLFLKHDESEKDYFLGHISHFSGKVEPLFSAAKVKALAEPRVRVKKISKRQAALDSL